MGGARCSALLGTALVARRLAQRRPCPGANDNLSGVAALVALAELLREQPLPGLRVLLVSCGAEETLQDGIRAFIARHRHELDAGAHVLRQPRHRRLAAPDHARGRGAGLDGGATRAPGCATCSPSAPSALGIALQRGFRARASTDSVIPSRAGYPTATLVSMTDWRSPANYHLPSDVPANLDFGTVADATRLVLRAGAVTRRRWRPRRRLRAT